MHTQNRISFRIGISLALLVAAGGSATMACLNRAAQVKLPALQFPQKLANWSAIKAPNNVDLADALEHEYAAPAMEASVTIRRSRHSGVLHDLTSCLIAANAHPIAIGQAALPVKDGKHVGQLVKYRLDGESYVALMWFQSKTVTATERWHWRWLNIANAEVRTAPVFYQAEVSVKDSGNLSADISKLQAIGVPVFNQLETM